jgi:membrane protease YdiL (CAAX protease family)
MSETKPSETKPKKMVRRSVAIALGIACIILVAIFGVFFLVVSFGDYLQSRKLNNQLSYLADIVDLKLVWGLVDEQLHQPANSYNNWTSQIDYAGYIWVWARTLTTDELYVRVIYSSQGVDFDNQVTMVGPNATAILPVLPTPSIEIRVGNTNLSTDVTEYLNVAYYY